MRDDNRPEDSIDDAIRKQIARIDEMAKGYKQAFENMLAMSPRQPGALVEAASSLTRIVHPTGPNSGVARVLRGGSWNCDPRVCRSAYRHRGTPTLASSVRGFRVVVEE